MKELSSNGSLLDEDSESPLNGVQAEDFTSLMLTYAVGGFLVFTIFMSIAGNLLVCLAIYQDRKLRKLSNLFLVSLAVADLFVASLVMPFAVANDLMGYWVFGQQFCETWIAFDVMACTSSILVKLESFFILNLLNCMFIFSLSKFRIYAL